jgi:hypothetical protein
MSMPTPQFSFKLPDIGSLTDTTHELHVLAAGISGVSSPMPPTDRAPETLEAPQKPPQSLGEQLKVAAGLMLLVGGVVFLCSREDDAISKARELQKQAEEARRKAEDLIKETKRLREEAVAEQERLAQAAARLKEQQEQAQAEMRRRQAPNN